MTPMSELLADLETLLAHATYLHAVAKQTNRGWSAFMSNVVEYARTSLEAERALSNDKTKGDTRASLTLSGWVRCADHLPPQDVDVETKIDDERGVRNVQKLRRHSNLWWFPDMSMYIYYSPTHWREAV